jgi:anti-sigma factor RsiW
MDSNSLELVCQELVELVTDYLNHTLPAADRVRFDAHLVTCPPCTSYLAQMKTTLELASELGKETATPKDVEQHLVSLFRRWHQK